MKLKNKNKKRQQQPTTTNKQTKTTKTRCINNNCETSFLYSPDQLPKSATLPKWAMLFLIRQSQIQNNPIMHCFY